MGKVSNSLSAYIRLCRLDRPATILLYVLPCWWGVSLGISLGVSSGSADFLNPQTLRLFLLFTLGAAVMRGAGCTLNDMADRNIDRHVARTKNRPLARGELPLFHAFIFFSVQCLAGLLVVLCLPVRCWLFAPIALVLLIIYPFMKRITYWPQLVLGIAVNLSIFFGVTACLPFSSFNWPAVLSLYGAGVAWTIAYDTIYALQDREDDLKIGMKSTAILFGSHVKTALYLAYGVMYMLLALVGYAISANSLYFVILGGGAVMATALLSLLCPKNSYHCLRAFYANIVLGFSIWTALLMM